jgi:stage III sporulation protein SpoIIIAA
LGSPSTFSEDESDVELGRLLSLLPEEMRRRVSEHPELQMLIEVVMDLGRKPLARFPSGDFVISEYPITVQDIQHATAQVFLELSFTRLDTTKLCILLSNCSVLSDFN